MEIFYSSRGIPTIVVDEIAYNFFNSDKGEILAQLSMNPEYIDEIKEKIIEHLQDLEWNNFSKESDSFSNIRSFLRSISEVQILQNVIDTLEEAYNTSVMLSTPQPYPSWMWEGGESKRWVAPKQYPSNADEGVYMWDEDSVNWIPAEQSPHGSWTWNPITLRYEPPVPYPVDAEPDKFVWDEPTQKWVLNEQMG